jgi:hypothetical protein
MATIKHLDKKTGITYVYESTSYWDKEKQSPRSHRTLIGKLDAATGKLIPTDGRNKHSNLTSTQIESKRGPVPVSRTERLFYGATYLFDQIGEKLGITADLKQCFPYDYKKILSLAYYLILEDNNAMSRFRKWGRLHRHPFDEDITSQRSSELFASISEAQKMKFFRLQGRRRNLEEFWAYDSTSISSYSEQLKLVKYGKNKDYDPLPQINLVLVFGETSNLPFYYRKLAGNIPDVKTVTELVKELDVLGYSKVKLVMDRGFYSAENINALYRKHYKFIVAASTSLSYAKGIIKKLGHEIHRFDAFNAKYELYVHSETIAWDYTQARPYKGDVITGDRRMYLHLYFNLDKAAEDEANFNRKMISLHEELLTGKRIPEHEKLYAKYFEVKETPIRGIQITSKQKAMDEASSLYGYMVLLSNEVKDPITALELYRNRDLVEKAFGNIKERLNCKRMLVSSDSSLEGKLFVAFVALIYLAYIKKQMQDKDLFKKYTMHELLDELDIIECFTEPGKAPYVGEVLQKQKLLYLDMEVEAPVNFAALC